MGSTSLITNIDGEVVQHVEYVPFGEVFIEERNNTWNTPFLFNAKELDEETGLYYYGARYYDARTSLWLSTDPMQEKYPGVSTYAYCANNPVKLIDPDGKEWGHFTKVTDADGNVTYKATLTGVVYNNSSSKVDMEKFRDAAVNQIKESYNFKGDGFQVSVDVQLRVVNSVDDIKETDHVIQIVDQASLGDGKLGKGDTQGLNIRIGSDKVGNIISGADNRTIPHEIGHTGGLDHPNKGRTLGENRSNNLMVQNPDILRAGGNLQNARKLTQDQIDRIWHFGETGNLNKYSPVETTITGIIGLTFPFLKTQKTLRK